MTTRPTPPLSGCLDSYYAALRLIMERAEDETDEAYIIAKQALEHSPAASDSGKEQIIQLLLNELVNPVNMSPWKEGLNAGLLRAIAIVKDFYHDQ